MKTEQENSEPREATALLSVRDVAGVLQVSIACVYAMVADGKVAVHRVGTGRGSIRIDRRDLDEYLSACRQERREKETPVARPRLKHLKL